MDKFYLKRNIRLLYLFSFLIKRPMIPILTLYYLFFNLTFTEIGIIAGITGLTTLILEIPSGIITDYIGKRVALIIASIFGLFSQLLYFIGNGFTPFLLAGIAFGVSVSFISGTRQSLLFETVKALGEEKKFKKYSGRVVFYGYFFNAVILLLVPFFYEINNKLPFLFGVTFFLFALIVAILIKDIEGKNKTNIIDHIKESFRQCSRNEKIKFAIFYNLAGSGLIFVLADYFQPILQSSGLMIIYFGFVYYFMRLAMAYGSRVTHIFEKYISNRNIVLIILGAFSFILFGLSLFNIILVIILLIIMRFFEGVHTVVVTDEIQQNITTNNRTTISSISNMYRSGYQMLLAPIMGMMTDVYGLSIMLICLAAFNGVITLIFIMMKPSS